MYSEIFVENIKCFGCKNTVIKEAKKQDLVESVDVDMSSGKVSLEYKGGEETLARVKSRLQRKGYPEKGSQHHKNINSTTCDIDNQEDHQKYRVKQFDIAED